MNRKKLQQKICREVKEHEPLKHNGKTGLEQVGSKPISDQLLDGFEEHAKKLGKGGQHRLAKTIIELRQDKDLDG